MRRAARPASKAYRPALTSGDLRSASVASLSSTIRSDKPAVSDHAGHSPSDRAATTAAKANADVSTAPCFEEWIIESGSISGTSPDSTTISIDVLGKRLDRCAQRVAGAARLFLEREVSLLREHFAGSGSSAASTRRAAFRQSPLAQHRSHRPASAGRRSGEAPSAGATSCACQGRRRGLRLLFGLGGRHDGQRPPFGDGGCLGAI